MTDIIGTGANELARETADKLAEDGETFAVLVYPAAVWASDTTGQRRIIPSWYLCMTLETGDEGAAFCLPLAPISPAAAEVRKAVHDCAEIVRNEARRRREQPEGTADSVWGYVPSDRADPVRVSSVTAAGQGGGLAAVESILTKPAVTITT